MVTDIKLYTHARVFSSSFFCLSKITKHNLSPVL